MLVFVPFCGPAKAIISDMAKRMAKTTVAMQSALFWEHTVAPLFSYILRLCNPVLLSPEK